MSQAKDRQNLFIFKASFRPFNLLEALRPTCDKEKIEVLEAFVDDRVNIVLRQCKICSKKPDHKMDLSMNTCIIRIFLLHIHLFICENSKCISFADNKE